MRPRNPTEDVLKAWQGKVRGGATGKPVRDGGTHVKSTGRTGGIPVAATNPAPAPIFKPFQIALTGQLPSGKNQVQLLFRNGKVMKYPNKTFAKWRAASMAQITPEFFRAPNIAQPVSLTVDYWPGDRRTRDVSGQLDALFHLLVYAKVLKDDGLIWNVTWLRHEMNKQFPKVVIEIEAYRARNCQERSL